MIEGFKRRHEYEVSSVQKKRDFDFAWVVASSPEQGKKSIPTKLHWIMKY